MNPYVAIGALLLIGVLAVYVVSTRREIAKLPPLEKETDKKPAQKKKRPAAPPAPAASAPERAVSEGQRPDTDPPTGV